MLDKHGNPVAGWRAAGGGGGVGRGGGQDRYNDPVFVSSNDYESADGDGHRRGGGEDDPPEHKVGLWMLVGLIFYSVSGGPLGSEVAVRSGGPALALLGFLVMPLVWSAPEAIMTAELSVAYPEAAGFSAWTNAAFGPFWSFLCSVLSWVSGVLDNAVYPVLMLE